MARIIRQLNRRSNEKPRISKHLCDRVWRFVHYASASGTLSCLSVSQRFKLSAAEVRSLVFDERFMTFGPCRSDSGKLTKKRAQYFLRANGIAAHEQGVTMMRRFRDRKRAKLAKRKLGNSHD